MQCHSMPVIKPSVAPASPTVIVYTDLATLLAASGSAEDRALFQTAGGDNICAFVYLATNGWVPDGWVDVTAAGADTAIGAGNIVSLAGSAPAFSGGFLASTGDEAYLKLHGPLDADTIVCLTIVTDCVLAADASPTAGAQDYAQVGWHSDAAVHGAQVYRFSEAAGSYAAEGGVGWGAAGAAPTSPLTGFVAAAESPLIMSGSTAQLHNGTDCDLVSALQIRERGEGLQRGSTTSLASVGMESGDNVLGVYFGVATNGTTHNTSVKLTRFHVSIKEA